jgi:hypothetical protein
VTVTTWQKRAGVTDEKVVRVDWTSLAIHIAFFTAAVSL